MSFVSTEDRITKGSSLIIDLAKQDYAVRLTDLAKNYIGAILDVKSKKCKIVAISTTYGFNGSNVVNSYEKFNQLLTNLSERLNVYDMLINTIEQSQLVKTPEEADLVIGLTKDVDINALTNAEVLNKLIF